MENKNPKTVPLGGVADTREKVAFVVRKNAQQLEDVRLWATMSAVVGAGGYLLAGFTFVLNVQAWPVALFLLGSLMQWISVAQLIKLWALETQDNVLKSRYLTLDK